MLCERCEAECEKRGPLQRYCDPCSRQRRLATKREHEARKRVAAGVIPLGGTLICQRCSTDCVRTNGQQLYCEPCAIEESREKHRLVNRKYEANRTGKRVRDPVKLREMKRLYAARNREKNRQRARDYQNRNRELINAKSRAFNKTARRREWFRKWETEKARTDPAFVLNRRMKTALRRGLKEGKNGRSWETLVGYTVADLKAHLERQFVKGMSWKNMGGWHIDHRQPLVSFQFVSAADEGFRAAWALTNLQPLWGAANVSKGGKRVFLI